MSQNLSSAAVVIGALRDKLPFVFKIFVLSIFEWPLKTGFDKLGGLSCKPNIYVS